MGTPLTLISPKSYLKGEQHNRPTAPPVTPTMVIIPPLANQRILFLGCTYNTPHTPTPKSIQFLFQICQNHLSHICKIIKFSPKKNRWENWLTYTVYSICNAMCFQWSSESVSTPQLSVFPMPPVNLPLCYSWHTQAVQCRSRRTWNLLFTAFYGRATVNSALGRETPQSRSHPTYIPKPIALRWSTAQTNLLMCKPIHYCTNQPTIVQNNPLERGRHCTHFDIGPGFRNIAGRWFLSIHCSRLSVITVFPCLPYDAQPPNPIIILHFSPILFPSTIFSLLFVWTHIYHSTVHSNMHLLM